METNKFIEIGGSPEKAVVGDYTLNVQAIIKEGWEITKTSKLPILLGLLFVLAIGSVFTMIASEYMGGIEIVLEDPNKQYILNLFATVILWPFIAGIEMMGVSHAVGIKTKSSFVFAFLKRSAFTALAALIITTISSLGFYLLFIPGIYLSVALSITIPLIVEKHMSPMAAIVLSLKATRFQWFKIFLIYLVLFMVLVCSLLPAATGVNPLISMTIFITSMLWLAPLFYNIKGILYREIFGLKMLYVESQDGSNKPDSFFSA